MTASIYLALSIVVLIIFITIIEINQNNNIKTIKSKPNANTADPHITKILESNVHALVGKLETVGELDDVDYETIEAACAYINNRYDCSDFRMNSLLRLIYKYSDRINPDAINGMKQALLNSRYFMNQPGEDGICHWSENHLLLFATAEYLTGQLYENETFNNDGLIGLEHKALAKERLMIWLKQRFYFGFTEWYSNTYYEEDIAPLSNIIEFCDDPEIVMRAKMVLDLLLFDVATQSYKGSFTSTSGRQYEAGKKSGCYSTLRNVTNEIWGYELSHKPPALDQCFLYMKGYEVPQVIKEIGNDHSPQIIKASTGMTLNELVKEFPDEMSAQRVMMQWGMEAFSNPQTISSAIKYINRYSMLSNEFLNDFRLINLSILKYTKLLPLVSHILRPTTNGTAIQRANTYTYKTEDYMLATAQKHFPGEFGDQQHIWSATLAKDLCVFTTHPACVISDAGALNLSPSYWVGNGRNPHAVQHKNINLSIYLIDGKKGFAERSLERQTHCYFPQKKFDEVKIMENAVFGKKDDALIAVRSINSLKSAEDEFIQTGDVSIWVTELGSAKKESFKSFESRILGNKLDFSYETLTLTYISNNITHKLTYKQDFVVDGSKMDTEYLRFDSTYSITDRKSDNIILTHKEHQLELNFEKGIREINTGKVRG